jgi:hypothetical protein
VNLPLSPGRPSAGYLFIFNLGTASRERRGAQLPSLRSVGATRYTIVDPRAWAVGGVPEWHRTEALLPSAGSVVAYWMSM